MQNRRYKQCLIWVGAVLVISCAILCLVESFVTAVRIRFADDQTAVFEQMRENVERSDPAKAADCLSYTLSYYPSGTKQVAGSPLDRVVERARRNALRQMIALLRMKTGRDFGDDPQSWIEGLKHLEHRSRAPMRGRTMDSDGSR
ncbi:MAG: hypothetical protein ACLQIB_04645 [Isosphaeraceae bacterium]